MKKSYVVLFHLIFWLPKLLDYYPAIMIFWMTIGPAHLTVNSASDGLDHYNLIVLCDIITSILSVIVFYLFYSYLFSQYVVNQKILQFAVYGFFAILITTVIDIAAGNILSHYFTAVVDKYKLHITPIRFLISFFRFMVYGITACMFKGFIGWYNDIRYKKELENRNLQTE